jgi:cytochrome c oxidase assembly protein subunit 15
MTTADAFQAPGRRTGSGALALGFATTVAMWGVGYVGRLPGFTMPSPVLLVLFLACLMAGGWVAGRYADHGMRSGMLAGLVAGLLNLLILGSLLGDPSGGAVAPAALIWVPGSLAISVLLGGVGGYIGASGRGAEAAPVDWTGTFAWVAVGATFLLLGVGGLVTSYEAGLAVVDWPNSYGYNMFLYPLSRMTGGVYYEHAHRLFGALVGLTTLVLAIVLQRNDDRRPVKALGWIALGMVIVQGVLGGLRVTGSFTLSTAAEDMAPSIALAVVHGVFGQLFFATLVGIGVMTTRTWRTPGPMEIHDTAGTDRKLGIALVGLLVIQLVLGALLRHLASMLTVHITLACLVGPLAIGLGARVWGLNPERPLLRRLGLGLIVVTALQLLLGIAAFVATGFQPEGAPPAAWAAIVATLHQWCGAAVLGMAVATTLWVHR